MHTFNWLYECTIILYAMSLLGYFIDFLQNNRKANRMAFWLLSIVWILQTTFFMVSFLQLNRIPILTPFEGLYFVTWMIVSLSLLINWFSRIDFFVFFANVIGLFMMTIHLFSPKSELSPLITETLTTELFFMHIAMAFLSYASFTLSFVFSLMYFIQYELLKSKKSFKRLGRFGSLSQLEKMAYFFVVIGVPLLFLSIIWGMVWVHLTFESFNYLDAKVVFSLIVLIVYSFYLYVKVMKSEQGKKLAFINIAAFLTLLINIFLSGSLTEFHWW